MGDDFDLFPKKENLDPFSFGRPEKKSEGEKGDESVDLFGLEEESPREISRPPEGFEERKEAAPQEKTFDEPIEGIGDEPVDETGDGAVRQTHAGKKAGSVRSGKKAPSPFVLIGGALVVILGLLYLIMTFFISDVPPTAKVPPPPPAVAVKPPASPPVPAPEPVQTVAPETVISPAEQETAPEAAPGQQVPSGEGLPPSSPAEPGEAGLAEKPPAKTPLVASAAPEGQDGRYSVQVGTFVLEPNARALEKEMADLGYETYREKGTAMRVMNVVTAGPFSDMEKGTQALTLIREAGIESTVTRRSPGVVVVNAGSFLLEKNAELITKKVQDLGYPVIRSTKEVNLPVIILKTGRFPKADDAALVRDELKGKGVQAMVVEAP